jgi:hypothetical protein
MPSLHIPKRRFTFSVFPCWFRAVAGPPNSVVTTDCSPKHANEILPYQKIALMIQYLHRSQLHPPFVHKTFSWCHCLPAWWAETSSVRTKAHILYAKLLCIVSWIVERGQFSCLLTVRIGWCEISTDICCNDSTYILDVPARPEGLVQNTSRFLQILVPRRTRSELGNELDDKKWISVI